jgi:uncharacterized protein (DUF1501 family)
MTAMRRRDFIRRCLTATAGSAAFGSLFGKLALANAAPQRTLLGGRGAQQYRALVCIYLYGGNDCFNMVVPRDAGHAVYAATRTNLAVAQAQLLPLNALAGPVNGGLFGLHPEMPGTQAMFAAGRAAIIGNVGPLVRPVNKASYQLPGTPLPAQLFSHSDQTVLWQTPRADTSARTGWGGRLADIFGADNSNPILSMNISLAGENVFQAGLEVAPYFMSTSGVQQINNVNTGAAGCADGGSNWNRRRCLTFNALLNQDHAHPFQRAYAGKMRSTLATSAELAAALEQFPASNPVFAPFWTENGLIWSASNAPALPRLAAQLLMIARVIQARNVLGMSW